MNRDQVKSALMKLSEDDTDRLEEAKVRVPVRVWITYERGKRASEDLAGNKTPDVIPNPVGIYTSESEAKGAARKGDLGIEMVNLSLPRV